MKPRPKFLLAGCIFLLSLQNTVAQESLTELYYSGNYNIVITLASDLIESGDTSFTTFYLKALSEIQTGQTIEAVHTLRAARNWRPGDLRITRMLAQQYYDAGNYTEAGHLYADLMQNDSSDVSTLLKLADIAYFRQDYNQAIETLTRIMVIDSINLTSLMKMGEILERNNNTGAGIYYERAYRLYPQNQKAAFALGNWFIQVKQAPKAIPVCEHMLVLDTTSIKFAKLLGYAYYKSGRPGDAVRYLEYANSLGDSTAFTFKFKGISHYLRADFVSSIQALDEAVQKDSMDAEVHFFLGASLATTREKSRAMDHLNTSLNLMQPDPTVVSRIYSEQGNIKRLEMEYEEAYAFYEKAWNIDSTNVMAIYLMASILDNSMHKSKEALADYERYIEALDQLPEKQESGQGVSIRAIVEDRIITLKEELFFRDEH